MGYIGRSESVRMAHAKEQGRYPLSVAKKKLKHLALQELGVKLTLKECEEWLVSDHSGEWHHSSKLFNKVKVYDTRKGIVDDKPYHRTLSDDLNYTFVYKNKANLREMNIMKLLKLEEESNTPEEALLEKKQKEQRGDIRRCTSDIDGLMESISRKQTPLLSERVDKNKHWRYFENEGGFLDKLKKYKQLKEKLYNLPIDCLEVAQ